ncbi:MAG: hypothetical protein ACM358_17040 [Gemmatimonadota bacterium]
MTAIAFRPAELGTPDSPGPDRHFVIDSWLASYRDAFTAGLIQVEDWYGVMIPQLDKVLAKPELRVVVASVAGVTDRVADLLGFIAADPDDAPPLVYYVFVKPHYRRGGHGRLWTGAGVGRGLFAAIGVDPALPFNYVCSTPACRTLQRKIPMAQWRPLLGRFAKSERRTR